MQEADLKLCKTMQTRFTVAEIGVDEIGSYLDRHHPDHPMIGRLRDVSQWLHGMLTEMQGHEERLKSIRAVQRRLTKAFPEPPKGET